MLPLLSSDRNRLYGSARGKSAQPNHGLSTLVYRDQRAVVHRIEPAHHLATVKVHRLQALQCVRIEYLFHFEKGIDMTSPVHTAYDNFIVEEAFACLLLVKLIDDNDIFDRAGSRRHAVELLVGYDYQRAIGILICHSYRSGHFYVM